MSNYMAGEDFPSIPNLVRISSIHKLPTDWLLMGDDSMLPKFIAKAIEEYEAATRAPPPPKIAPRAGKPRYRLGKRVLETLS